MEMRGAYYEITDFIVCDCIKVILDTKFYFFKLQPGKKDRHSIIIMFL